MNAEKWKLTIQRANESHQLQCDSRPRKKNLHHVKPRQCQRNVSAKQRRGSLWDEFHSTRFLQTQTVIRFFVVVEYSSHETRDRQKWRKIKTKIFQHEDEMNVSNVKWTHIILRLVASTALILAHNFFRFICFLFTNDLCQSTSVRVPSILAFINHRR